VAYEGWFEYSGGELINAARTRALARSLNISAVRLRHRSVSWIENTLTGVAGFGLEGFGLTPFGSPTDYPDITGAPWYDSRYEASEEFAGFVPLNVAGLSDSTLVSDPVEYVTDGGHPGRPRNAVLPLVFTLALVAKTPRGAEYGKAWLDNRLRDTGRKVFCAGADLTYFRYPEVGSPKAHRRNVRLTRGTSVTKKYQRGCAVLWFLNFTMTAADPFEYGEPQTVLEGLGTASVSGPNLLDSGSTTMTQQPCPVYDYSPVYDPLYPALVAPPALPNLYPEGWLIQNGMSFRRYWAEVEAPSPKSTPVVPLVKIDSSVEWRSARLSVWSEASGATAQCDPLFETVLTYIPQNQELYVDGEQKAVYVWDGSSAIVRRADSLAFSGDAEPVQWLPFNDAESLFITLDFFQNSGAYPALGDIEVEVQFISKTD